MEFENQTLKTEIIGKMNEIQDLKNSLMEANFEINEKNKKISEKDE